MLLAMVASTALALEPRDTAAQELIADLSKHRVAITTGFTGDDVLLFGATEGPGEVVVVVRGPIGDVVVREKQQIAGIWINRRQVRFTNVPQFYALASSAPLETLVSPGMAARNEIGTANLRIRAESSLPPEEIARFRQALFRNKAREGLYPTMVSKVDFRGPRLFRTTIHFPANVPTGGYEVRVYLIRDGQDVSVQSTPLYVSKIGVGADVSEFAYNNSVYYGLIAIAIAMLAGWVASVIFHRV
ncbi:MAG TPA: TIGR02186 family protein [Alphaproteobacteria bacterium]